MGPLFSKASMGETGRQLQVRFKEHIDAFEKSQLTIPAFAAHLLASGHLVEKVNVSLIHEVGFEKKRLALVAFGNH